MIHFTEDGEPSSLPPDTQNLITFDKDYNITYIHPNILSSLSQLLLRHIREKAWNVPMSEEWTKDQ